MSEVRFYLDKPKSAKETFIFLYITLADGRLLYTTEFKIHPDQWDKESQRATKNNKAINIELSRLVGLIEKTKAHYLLLKKPLTKAVLRAVLDDHSPAKLAAKSKKSSFLAPVNRFIDDAENGTILTKSGKRYAAETIKGYRHTRDNLVRFEREAKVVLQFDTVSMDTYNDIIAFYNKHDHSINSIGKIIKNFKVFMKQTHAAGVHSNLIYEKFRIPEEETDDIYLSGPELMAIYNLDLTGQKSFDLVRDNFLIDCYTGLRISDMKVFTSRNISGDFITMATEKTDTKVIIPIHPIARAILQKHGGVPKKVSEQDINRKIKVICKDAGITDDVLYSVTKGGRRQDFYLKKWEMVSNHTARRAFITNLIKAGVRTESIMQMTGIKKYATIAKYNKMTPEENAEIMSKHAYFRDAG